MSLQKGQTKRFANSNPKPSCCLWCWVSAWHGGFSWVSDFLFGLPNLRAFSLDLLQLEWSCTLSLNVAQDFFVLICFFGDIVPCAGIMKWGPAACAVRQWNILLSFKTEFKTAQDLQGCLCSPQSHSSHACPQDSPSGPAPSHILHAHNKHGISRLSQTRNEASTRKHQYLWKSQC